MMLRQKRKMMLMDSKFHTALKRMAAENEMSITKFTEVKGEELEDILNKKKKERKSEFDFRL